MQRLTRTKLEKLLYIHDCRVDQIVEGACSKLDDVVFDPGLESLRKILVDEEQNPWAKEILSSTADPVNAVKYSMELEKLRMSRMTRMTEDRHFTHPSILWPPCPHPYNPL